MKRFPSVVRRLLLSSLVLVLGRSVAVPFLAVYLSERLKLEPEQVGFMLGSSLVLATIFGLYAGYLADRFNKRRLIAISTLLVALSLAAITMLHNIFVVVLVLACTEAGLALRGITLKACLAEQLPPEERGRAFAANYTLINVAFSVGPLIGAAVIGFGASYPFWIAAGFAAVSSSMVPSKLASRADGVTPVHVASRSGFLATLSAMKEDRRLMLFTLGSFLTAFVYGRFSAYLSEYLIVAEGTAQAYRLMPELITTNAVAVVLMQYPIGKLLSPQHLMRWIGVGSAMFVLSLIGFMFATTLWMWLLAMIVFTVGEVIVAPAEYLFIDLIAPESKKGSYYGVQNLSNFGRAASQAACGVVLSHGRPGNMFVMLGVAVTAGAVLYYAGARSSFVLPPVEVAANA